MHLTVSLLTCVVCVSLVASIRAAGPYPTKGKPGKGKLKVKDTGVALMPNNETVATDWGIVLCDAQTGEILDGPRVLTPKIKKKTGAVKKWFAKEKKVAIVKYKPSKRKLVYKVWKTVPTEVLVGIVSPDMVCVPSGTFAMGDCIGGEGDGDEVPLHSVTLSSFFVDAYEVSNAKMRDALQWALDEQLVIADAASVKNADGDSKHLVWMNPVDAQITYAGGRFTVKLGKAAYPCVYVTWYGACAYCNFRSLMEGKAPCYDFTDWSCDWSANGYRLLTEAEWEKAARGGDAGNRFPWADVQNISHARANYNSSGGLAYDASGDAGYHPSYETVSTPFTSPCGVFTANGYGLHDAAGNVWEWVWDRWSSGYYLGSPGFDPTGPATGSQRTLRSGSWKESARHCRASNRGAGHDPDNAHNHFGFRAACR